MGQETSCSPQENISVTIEPPDKLPAFVRPYETELIIAAYILDIQIGCNLSQHIPDEIKQIIQYYCTYMYQLEHMDVDTNPPQYEFLFKTICVGARGCGKTALIERFVDDKFEQRQCTIIIGRDFVSDIIKFNQQTIKLQLWDQAPSRERFRSISSAYFRGADGCFVLFDINDKQSFDRAIQILQDLANNDNYGNQKMYTILVGTKCDIIQQRPFDENMIHQLSEKYHVIYFETSSKDSTNVEYLFAFMTQQMLKKVEQKNTYQYIQKRYKSYKSNTAPKGSSFCVS